MRYNEFDHTIYGKSTEEKPAGTFGNINIEEGQALYCTDNGTVFIFDGENWVEQ